MRHAVKSLLVMVFADPRAALGLPPIGRYRVQRSPRTKPKRVIRKWRKAESHVVLTLPLEKARKRLPGRTKSAILTIRSYLRRKGAEVPFAKLGRPKLRDKRC